ncbi:aminopeptidase P N-terminal domain-containing protein [Piscinibacter koreensis]|uniref:Xaa-Pro aminopeptidase n=1 Tax=Piscinibacter koreensis TaxID=2742824 RepID=A0A7Y6TV52_9BURK|nr:aminopeptidase P N-terminal domain-containing protein [Schlegelella koreensis]NUZ04685.1 aminopeptidase P N-terminal domain-containing protein [Schlegelella koreensis]
MTTEYAARRQRIAAAMQAAGGGVAVIATAPERPRNGDSDHPYRHDSSFHYLTGFDEPGAWLVVDAAGRSTLFCRPKDLEREIWDGYRLGPDAAPAALGVDAAFPTDALDAHLPDLLADRRAVWVPASRTDVRAPLDGWLATLRSRERMGVEAPTTLHDLDPLLAEMRLVKDAGEIATMRRAAAISAGAHARAMRFCAARFAADPGGRVREYEIEAELLHEFRRHGAQAPAYPSIVAAGANACVLHYAAAHAELTAGELCLIDAGCELDGYASDITRTFPGGGRFSAAQRELYDVVLAAQAAAVEATRPGARQRDAHHAAVRVLAQGMLDTGLLDRGAVGDLDAVTESAAYRRFYMHGTGHWLGRDVHDVGNYAAMDEAPVEQPDGLGGRVTKKPSRVLEPGMVVTIEPGLYVRPAPDVPERFWNIGIRIEDDAVVTADGCELITRGVPVEADAIEALMREAADAARARRR